MTTLSQVLSTPDDNFIEYFIYALEPESLTEVEALEELAVTLNAAALALTKDYLWQKEPLILRPQAVSHCLHGLTHYGDTVEDEWFIVHVLTQLSIQFPQLVVRVIDQDGEFLLIEASEHLPKWAESDATCQQRVYIFQGKLHLVEDEQSKKTPISDSDLDEQDVEPIPVIDAIQLIQKNSERTLANAGIQEAISKRVGSYPEKMIENTHWTSLVLPPKLAVILKNRPDLVSAAIRAFYYRDPIDLKSARLMRILKPGDGLVKTRVRFTKTLYAMLSSQEFRPDTKSGWTLPSPTSKDFKGHNNGAKLALGFEIILSRAKTETVSSDSSNFTSSAWLRYEEKLKGYGYYKGFIEGSKAYKELQERAKIFFQTSLTVDKSEHPDDVILKDLQTLLQSVVVDLDALKSDEASLPPDDDDSWLEYSADDLESMLEAQFKTKISDQKLDQIPEKLKEFMSQISDFKGVEIPTSSQNGASSSGAGGSFSFDEGLEPLDFRADDFVSALDKLLLELGNPDKDWDASDDEYFSEEDETLEEIKKMHTFAKDSKIHQLMKEMDQELESTEVGKTFAASSNPSTSQQAQASSACVEELDDFDNEPQYKPVDIDMNALANILESYQSQEDGSGPSVNLLRSVGFDISKAKK